MNMLEADARVCEAVQNEWLMRDRALRAEAINRDLREQIAKFKDAAEECASGVSPLSWKIENLESDLTAAKEDVAAYKASLKSAADCTNAQRERAIRAEAKNRDLQEKVARLKRSEGRCKGLKYSAEAENRSLKGALGRAVVRIAKLSNTVRDRENEIKCLNEKVGHLENIVSNQADRIRDAIQKDRRNKAHIWGLEKEIGLLWKRAL